MTMGGNSITSYKRWGPMIAGLLIGAGIGYIYGDLIQFALYGYFAGIIVGVLWAGQTPAPTDPAEKRMRQQLKWLASIALVIGAILNGVLSDDVIGGLGLGIGLVIVVGLSWGTVYDERMAEVYNKATRNAFIVISMGMSLVGFLPSLFVEGMPLLWGLLGANKLLSVLWIGWGVFGISLAYYNHLSVD